VVSGEFGVDTGELKRLIERMGEVEQRAEAAIAAMDSEVHRLHGTWTGEAAAGHASAHAMWAKGAQQMREALNFLRGAGQVAHGNYTSAATINTTMWS
jgi:WXG100 family type VII secretion target